jgi:hypothetical protein
MGDPDSESDAKISLACKPPPAARRVARQKESSVGASRGAGCVSGRQLLLDERMQDRLPSQAPVPVVSPFGKV